MTPQERSFLGFLARHLATGIAAGALFGAAILASDFAGLRRLTLSSDTPVLALALLFFGLFITFGSVSMAANLMMLQRKKDD
ncbi:hypothetical protein [Pelagibius sp.]|uniref:hypothetical protein n=1 Tax=Pelagibius sp. TaxID=1931238 RepID=UPI002606B8E3|nr:hypothetical protein [Pelagibius sp.]